MARGQLRVYLGAAPGVGKTYAMLAEGQRRRARGTDVVIALAEPHGRQLTSAMASGLETIPRRTVSYRGTTFTEMDTGAVLARHPQVALVDELAHTNVPGSKNGKRWQDVEELLAAGINVVTTLNIQHLESLADVARQITGVAHTERIPDEVARRADQLELVDMTPEALRRRLVHGNVYPPDRIEEALTHYFRPGNLTALRELALLWLADRVEEGLMRYRAEHGIAAPWETIERIVVGVAGDADDEAIIHRAARIATRTPGSELFAVHVRPEESGLLGGERDLTRQRDLVAAVGGTFQVVAGTDVPGALLAYARAQNATQMVLGATRRGRLRALAGGTVPARLAAAAGHIDVHVVGHDRFAAGHARRPSRARAGPAKPGQAEAGQAGQGEAGQAEAGAPWRPAARRALRRAALLLAAVARLAPWSLWLARRERARQRSAEAIALRRLAIAVLAGRGDPPALLEEIREMFGLAAVSLLERRDRAPWYIVASAGERPPEDPDGATAVRVAVSDTLLAAGRGRELSQDETRVLEACVIPLVTGIARRRQDVSTAQAADETWRRSRWALLTATSQDTRRQVSAARDALTAIAAAGASAGAGTPGDELATAWRALHRISQLAADLEAMGRARAGALETYLRPVDIDEVLTAALDDLGPGGYAVTVGSLADLPDVIADAALLTRVLASLLADSLARSRGGSPPQVSATADTAADGTVRISVVDSRRWPDQEAMPVRLARDLTEAMGGTLSIETGPGGGAVIVIALPAARHTIS